MGAGCDIYSLGIMLYELLTGEVPLSRLDRRQSDGPDLERGRSRKPSAVKSGIDAPLEAICLKMIAKRPEDRFASMGEVVAALDAYTAGRLDWRCAPGAGAFGPASRSSTHNPLRAAGL